MKTKILIFMVFLTCADLFAQFGWVFQNPYPCSDEFIRPRMLNANTGFICGSPDCILKTTNGGANWTVVRSLGYPNHRWQDISFENNGNTGLVVGYEYPTAVGEMLRSTDGGNTWLLLPTLPPGPNTNRYFTKVDAENGKVRAALFNPTISKIYSTNDYGNTWFDVSPPPADYINDFDWINSSTGWLVGNNGVVYWTTNGGNNWSAQTSGTSFSLSAVHFINANTGWIGGPGGLRKTTNAGTNWNVVNPSFVAGELFFRNENDGFALTSTNVYKTNDGGVTWNVIFTGTPNVNYAVDFYDLIVLLTGLQTREILKSTDNGNNWTNLSSGVISGQLKDITFVDQNTGVACGTGGTVMRTTNGGNNWMPSMVGSSHLRCIRKTPALDLFMGGENGTVYKSTNSGANWILQAIGGATEEITSMLWKIATNPWCLLSVNTNKVYKSTNDGLNWIGVSLPNSVEIDKLFEIDLVPGMVYGAGKLEVMAGDNTMTTGSYVAKSTDAGSTWVQVLGGTYAPLNDLYFFNQNTGYVVGEMCTVLKTTNAGASWQQVNVPGDAAASLVSVKFVSPSKGYILNAYSQLIYTSDGGTTWTTLNLPTNQGIQMYFRDSLNVYIVGGYGTIIKSGTGGLPPIGIKQVSSTIPESFVLSQNYPNPFNPTTNIKFQISRKEYVKLIIYDMLGKEMAVLVNEEMQAGSYQTEWDASGFSSGVYFYQLTAGDYSGARKMLLIK